MCPSDRAFFRIKNRMHIEVNSVSAYEINRGKSQMLTWNLAKEEK